VLGVCLGVQLLARASGAWVGRMPDGPEIGWHSVELTEAGAADPVVGALPQTFEALQWHHYTYGLPGGAVELARSPACTQAFRLGDACWGVQFHPEVTAAQLEGWLADKDDPPPDAERLREETIEKIDGWNELGRSLCAAFLDTAADLVATRSQSSRVA
jgi:GMP synthase (glutamine-hydrolysing)